MIIYVISREMHDELKAAGQSVIILIWMVAELNMTQSAKAS